VIAADPARPVDHEGQAWRCSFHHAVADDPRGTKAAELALLNDLLSHRQQFRPTSATFAAKLEELAEENCRTTKARCRLRPAQPLSKT